MSNLFEQKKSRGFILLLSVVVAGLVLAIGLSILSISLKQFKISGIADDSEKAFHAAYAGIECARYWDLNFNKFNFGNLPARIGSAEIDCMGKTNVNVSSADDSGTGWEKVAIFDSGSDPGAEWSTTGDPTDNVCAQVDVYKFFDDTGDLNVTSSIVPDLRNGFKCAEDAECTVIQARGYNRPCDSLDSIRTVEREILIRY